MQLHVIMGNGFDETREEVFSEGFFFDTLNTAGITVYFVSFYFFLKNEILIIIKLYMSLNNEKFTFLFFIHHFHHKSYLRKNCQK